MYTTCLLSKKYTTFDELIQAARDNPGTVKFGTELATNDTAIIAMMEDKFDVQYQLVDAGAVSDQIAAMMGDHIDFMKAPVGLVKDYVTSGDFHLLAFFNEQRNPDYRRFPPCRSWAWILWWTSFSSAAFQRTRTGRHRQVLRGVKGSARTRISRRIRRTFVQCALV